MTETPKEAARRLAQPWMARGYIPEALHVYRYPDGRAWYSRIRLKHPNGDKIIRPMRLNGQGFELREPEFQAKGKPLYNLHRIAANTEAPVWIVEGEKDADALTKLGTVATTSGGAQSASAADWTPLRGRECRLWADNDDPGKAYMGDVAAILQELGCQLSALDVDALALPPKGGAADWVKAHPGATLTDLDAITRVPARAVASDVSNPSGRSDRSTAGDSGPRVELIRGGDVVPEAIVWLWKDWGARGKLHILAGPPGTGKTTLALALAATITNAGRWPDGTRAGIGDVVIWSGEDGIADTLLPRLLANGADRDRVHFVRDVSTDGERRPFDPATDTPALALELSRLPAPPALLIVDPIVSAVAGDSHKNADTRRSLQPLVDIGERIGCAILGISHFSKGTSGRDPVERVTGSIAFGALARVVLAAVKTTKDDGTPGPRLFARAKSNNGPSGGGFHYDLEQVELTGAPGVFASRVLWGEPVEGEAHVLLATAEQPPDADSDTRSATDEAVQWLGEYLEDGPMPATGAIRAARGLGYSDKVLRKARERLGVQSRKVGLREGWEWAIDCTKAPKAPEDVEDAQQNRRGTFDAFGESGAPSGAIDGGCEVF